MERNSEGDLEGGSIVLNATAEFCRTLGDIPTYGLAGNRDEDAQELLVSVSKLVHTANHEQINAWCGILDFAHVRLIHFLPRLKLVCLIRLQQNL